MKTKKLVIYGLGAHAEMVYSYFEHDSDYEVVAFTVEKRYITKNELFGKEVIPFELIDNIYPPSSVGYIYCFGTA